MLGNGDEDRNTYSQFEVGTFKHLNNLDKGNVYKLIYPSIEAETHRFNSELQ